MVESRPASVRSFRSTGAEKAKDMDERDDSSASERDEPEGAEESEDEDPKHDTRSIMSFGSMMSERSKRPDRKDRMSLSDRLANMSRLTRGSPSSHSHEAPIHHNSPPARPISLLAASHNRFDTPVSSRTSSPVPSNRSRMPPPHARFLDCEPDDLKVSEIPELLAEYRRLVEGVRAMGGFDDTFPLQGTPN